MRIFLVQSRWQKPCSISCLLYTSPVFRQVFRKYDDLNASVQENVSAIRVVKAYVREDHETQKFHTANDNVYRLFVKAETVLALNSPVMQFTMYMCILAISWLGAHMIAAHSLTTGQLMSQMCIRDRSLPCLISHLPGRRPRAAGYS